MNQISKLLGRQHLSYKNVKNMKDRLKKIKKELKQYSVSIDVSNDYEFFKAEVIYESFLNKRTFETTYESLRSELYDAWEHLEHSERKNYVEIALKPEKERMKFFYSRNNKVIRIAFFDELLNSMYENEMVIFERPQYFSLENHFNTRMIDIEEYSYRPFLQNFASCEVLDYDYTSFVIFSQETKCLYCHNYKNRSTDVYPLDRNLNEFDHEKLKSVSKAILVDNQMDIAQALIDSELVSKKITVKLKKYIIKGR